MFYIEKIKLNFPKIQLQSYRFLSAFGLSLFFCMFSYSSNLKLLLCTCTPSNTTTTLLKLKIFEIFDIFDIFTIYKKQYFWNYAAAQLLIGEQDVKHSWI